MSRARIYHLMSRRETVRMSGLARDRAAQLDQVHRADALDRRLTDVLRDLAPPQVVTSAAHLRDLGLLAQGLAQEAERLRAGRAEAEARARELGVAIGHHDQRRRQIAEAALTARAEDRALREERARDALPPPRAEN